MRLRRQDDEIHLYSGWDDSVVWFGVPIAYAETGLSAGLVAELADWGTAMREREAASGAEPGRRSTPAAARLRERIRELAQQVADEVGRDFTVAVPQRRGTLRVRSARAATNPAAARAFAGFREREARWHGEVKRALRKGGPLRWTSSRDREMP